MNIIINNREARLIQLPAVAPKVATGKEIVKHAVLDANGVMIEPPVFMEPGDLLEPGYDMQQLKPGQNDVDSDYWDCICKHKGVKRLLAVGWLKNLGEGKAASLVADISKVDTATAKQMILEATSMGSLTAWAETTENTGLKKLINERKAELIDQADGRPARGPAKSETDLGTFGDGVTAAQVDGSGEASHGVGEAG